MSIPTPTPNEVSASQTVEALLDDIGGPEAGDRISYEEMEALDDMAQRMLDQRYLRADLRLIDTGDEWRAEPTAYLDAVQTAHERGTQWQQAYVQDGGWDAVSVAETAKYGPSEVDMEALGPHIDDLVHWCQDHPAAHADDPENYEI